MTAPPEEPPTRGAFLFPGGRLPTGGGGLACRTGRPSGTVRRAALRNLLRSLLRNCCAWTTRRAKRPGNCPVGPQKADRPAAGVQQPSDLSVQPGLVGATMDEPAAKPDVRGPA